MAMHSPHRDSSSSGISHTKFEREQEHEHQHEREHDELNHTSDHLTREASVSAGDRLRRNINAKLANPLASMSHVTLMDMGAKYAMKHQIGGQEDIRAFQIGACLAQDPSKYETVQGLTPEELHILRKEITNRWSQPRLMYIVIILCSTCAAVQGMGELTLIHRTQS